MFAWDCAETGGVHLGTCIDRFYFGSCCKVPDVIDANDLTNDGSSGTGYSEDPDTAQVAPAVTTEDSVPASTVSTTITTTEAETTATTVTTTETEVTETTSTSGSTGGVSLVTAGTSEVTVPPEQTVTSVNLDIASPTTESPSSSSSSSVPTVSTTETPEPTTVSTEPQSQETNPSAPVAPAKPVKPVKPSEKPKPKPESPAGDVSQKPPTNTDSAEVNDVDEALAILDSNDPVDKDTMREALLKVDYEQGN